MCLVCLRTMKRPVSLKWSEQEVVEEEHRWGSSLGLSNVGALWTVGGLG